MGAPGPGRAPPPKHGEPEHHGDAQALRGTPAAPAEAGSPSHRRRPRSWGETTRRHPPPLPPWLHPCPSGAPPRVAAHTATRSTGVARPWRREGSCVAAETGDTGAVAEPPSRKVAVCVDGCRQARREGVCVQQRCLVARDGRANDAETHRVSASGEALQRARHGATGPPRTAKISIG